MFIAHLPIGYLATRLAGKIWPECARSWKLFAAAGLLGSIVPDLDMLYFHLIDQRQHHHHSYWTHLPVFWVIVMAAAVVVVRLVGKRSWLPLVSVFGANIFLHLLADTIVGDIWWLAPFVTRPYAFFTVPALYQPWWLNFILHWSFALEVTLLVAAGYLSWRSRAVSGDASGRAP